MGVFGSREEEVAVEVNPLLGVHYEGPMHGRFPKDKKGVLLTNKLPDPDVRSPSALHPQFIQTLLLSLGIIEQNTSNSFPIVHHQDYDEFTIKLSSPFNLQYKPFYFNRREEYGKNHKYYEAICHGFPSRDAKQGCSARYFSPTSGLLLSHVPAPLQISAFISAIESLNPSFLSHLREQLSTLAATQSPPIPTAHIDLLLPGLFRSVSIQFHRGAPSHSLDMLLHQDHVFSTLHLALTLSGHRTVGLVTSSSPSSGYSYLLMRMNPGDVYVTTPAGVMHGIEMEEMGEGECSVAIQFRWWMEQEVASSWARAQGEMCAAVAESLREHPLRMPTFEEWRQVFEELKVQQNVTEEEKEAWVFQSKVEKKELNG